MLNLVDPLSSAVAFDVSLQAAVAINAQSSC